MNKREISIDLLKIVASFAVICLHIVDVPSNTTEQWIYYLSGCAIPLLLMVNGYLLLNKEKITLKRQSIKSLKILSIVFVWCAIFSCLHFITEGIWLNPVTSTWEGLIQKGPLWQFWFIGALILLHLFLPVLHKVFKKPRMAFFITLIFILISASADIVNVFFVSVDKPLIQSYVPQTFRLWTYFAYFFLGGFLGKPVLKEIIKSEISRWRHFLILVVLSIIVVYYQIYMGATYYGTSYAEYFYDNIFIMIWNLVLFTFLNRITLKNRYLTKGVEFISVNTFGIYAIHIYLMEILRNFVDYRNHDFVFWVPLLVFVVGQIISILLRTNKFTRVLVTF